MTYYVSSGTLNPTHSLTYDGDTGVSRTCIQLWHEVQQCNQTRPQPLEITPPRHTVQGTGHTDEQALYFHKKTEVPVMLTLNAEKY